MRDEVVKSVTSVSKSSDGKIYARCEDPQTSSVFDHEGRRLSGILDLEPEEVLYLVWRQRQSPSLKESRLREIWKMERPR